VSEERCPVGNDCKSATCPEHGWLAMARTLTPRTITPHLPSKRGFIPMFDARGRMVRCEYKDDLQCCRPKGHLGKHQFDIMNPGDV
jgi:hypothetical protein